MTKRIMKRCRSEIKYLRWKIRYFLWVKKFKVVPQLSIFPFDFYFRRVTIPLVLFPTKIDANGDFAGFYSWSRIERMHREWYKESVGVRK